MTNLEPRKTPVQPRSNGLAEFTLKAVFAGVLLGVVFGAANAYLGLRVGMTVSAIRDSGCDLLFAAITAIMRSPGI